MRILSIFPFKPLGWILIGLTFSGNAAAEPGMDFPPATYTQEIKLTFRDAAAAARAELSIEPLYDGYHRAVSCRWDDNATGNPETRRRMEKHGVRGTWYLNTRHHGSGYAKPGENFDYLETARGLLAGGNSIGAHSLTHPFITYFHRNRMFEETAGCRVEWEANLDTPVVSYACSFIDLRAEPENKEIQLEIMRTLERAGIYHTAEYVNFFNDLPHAMEVSPIMPTEFNPIDVFTEAVNWAYKAPELDTQGPMISNSMHAWYGTRFIEYGFDELERRLAVMAGLKDVWHCNQNSYAAYRRQFRVSRIAPPQVGNATVTVKLERPCLIDLNDPVPLTLAVKNVSQDDLLQIECATAETVPSKLPREGKLLFHLAHDRTQQMPVKIGLIANPENRSDLESADPDFPEIPGLLHSEGGHLILRLRNRGDQPLENLRVTWRLPLEWKKGVHIENIGQIGAGEEQILKLEPTFSGSEKSRFGSGYFVAQVDFSQAGDAGRIHFTCNTKAIIADASWPIDGFSLLGPIPKERFDAEALVGMIETEDAREILALEGLAPLTWRANSRDGFIRQEWLDPEYIRTMGTWDAAAPGYLLRSNVNSPVARPVEIICSRPFIGPILLNGKRVVNFKAELKAGDNELVILYPPEVLRVGGVRLAACFLRLVDPATGARLKDISYNHTSR